MLMKVVITILINSSLHGLNRIDKQFDLLLQISFYLKMFYPQF